MMETTRRGFIGTIIAGAYALPSVATRFADLEPIDWLNYPKGVDVDTALALAYWECCEFCYETAADDYRAGLFEPRAFYNVRSEGYSVCEHCVPRFLLEAPCHP